MALDVTQLDDIVDKAFGAFKDGVEKPFTDPKARELLVNRVASDVRHKYGEGIGDKMMTLIGQRLDNKIAKDALALEKDMHWSGTGAFGHNTGKALTWTSGKVKGFAGGAVKWTVGTAAVVAAGVALSNMFKKKPEDAQVAAPDYATQPGFPPVMQPEMMMAAPPAPLGMAPDGRPVYGQFSAQAAGMGAAPALNPRMSAGNFTDAVQTAGAAPGPLGAA